MGDPSSQPLASSSLRPSVVVVSQDGDVRSALVDELRKRYGAEYEIAAFPTEQSRVGLAALAESESPVALVIGGVGGLDADGITAIADVRHLHPTALYVAAVRWGDFE